MAAAIGAGIDITKPDGHMVVDIGGGTTDVAVISLGGVVESDSIKIAGDQFDEGGDQIHPPQAQRAHWRAHGGRAENVHRLRVPRPEEQSMEIKGRCLMTGLPLVFTVTSSEMIEAFEEPAQRILEPSTACWSAPPRSWWPISPPTASS